MQTVLFIFVQSGNSTFFDIKKRTQTLKREQTQSDQRAHQTDQCTDQKNKPNVDVDNSVWTAYCLQPFYKLKSQKSMQSSMDCLLFTTFVVYKLKSQASMGIVQVIWLLHNVFTVCLTIYHRCLDTTHVKMFQRQKYI